MKETDKASKKAKKKEVEEDPELTEDELEEMLTEE